ncbi:hypothetical protein K2173_001372 [Erythroxylum novogranatense]|uniref:BHLH domain-containing protein n=1 Tax=Erythroxylum novogranatense TaxID=1862640 RepID=A0AAV8T3J6_9ROSI|nr:hypothetical protein K2173_001372 [Erythroxylum novogranatense]
MAEFEEYLQTLRPYQPSTEMDMNVEMMKQQAESNPSMLENLSVAGFSVLQHSFLAHQQPEFPASDCHNNLFSALQPDILSSSPIVHTVISNQNNTFSESSENRKEMEQSSSNSKGLGKRTKGKNKIKEVEKAEEIIHFRAKRGQATDSHSIAERVRREKINNKLQYLQDIVPGCHKAMGMALMLEEIINYVHSLHNQIEFLSMQLAAASSSYDQNLEIISSKNAQGPNSPEANEMKKWPRGQYGELNFLKPTWSI